MKFCQVGDKAIVEYFYKKRKKRYETKDTSIGIEIKSLGESQAAAEMIKYGSSVTVPREWLLGADVFLYGVRYTAPQYPNCPSAYGVNHIGSAKAGQQLQVVHTAYPDACTSAHFASVPAVGHYDGSTQFPGASAKIGLKKILGSECKIEVSNNSDVVIFTDDIDCDSKYEVDCGSCPDGYLKCSSEGYPGYCCLPCQPTANKIRALGNKLQ